MKKQNKGITLIALVITIIVLLILAGVSIATLTGENGILTQAESAKDKTEEAEVIERVQVEVVGSYGTDGNIDFYQLNDNLRKNVKGLTYNGAEISEDDTNRITTLPATVNLNGYDIEIKANGSVGKKIEVAVLPTTNSYVGYYANIDGEDGVDGIIYADLAVGGKGIWNDDSCSEYSYNPVTEGLKSYTVSEEEYTGFGDQWTKPIITAVEGSGTVDRFYVMALEDFNPGTWYCWYDAAYSNLDDPIDAGYNDFGEGKQNTIDMIAKWNLGENEGGYGKQDNNGTYADMWGAIQTEVGDINDPTWFVPSKAEWSAFGDFAFTQMGVSTSKYSNYGLSDWYWSSAQRTTRDAYIASFNIGSISSLSVNYDIFVRLSATF